MMAFGFVICLSTISLICFSISLGWSPTGTFVKPGRSTRVRVRTLGEYIRRLIGAGEMPALRPVFESVSLTISSLILLKSKNFCPGMCRNSPHSSTFAALSVVAISPLTPFVCGLSAGGDLLMSCRMSGRLVTMPVPLGRLLSCRQLPLPPGTDSRTNLVRRCSLRLSSSHLTVTLRPLSVGDLWGSGPRRRNRSC